MEKMTLIRLTLCLMCTMVIGSAVPSMADNTSQTNQEAEQHFEKGNALLKRLDYEAAIAEYNKVIALAENSTIAQDAQYWIGQSHFRAGQFDAAEAAFAKLIEQYPTSAIVPVTKLMVERVGQAGKIEEKRRAMSNTEDKGSIVDPYTGVKYTKTRTFAGKRDVVTQVAWQLNLSPNGKFLIWNKLVIPLDGGEPFDLVDAPASLGIWSPDGKKVVFRSEGAIWVIPVSSETGRSMGPAKKLLDGGYQYDPFVGWSPNSEKIVFERKGKEGRGNISTLSVRDGTLIQITNDPIREWRPVWSPDGKSIAYNRGSELRVMPAEGGPSRKLVDNGLACFWSPDSEWLVYGWHGRLRFSRIADGCEFVWGAPNAAGRFISWSPNGKKMLFYRSSYDWRSALKVVSASGGPSFELGRQTELSPQRQYWSPDSRMIVTEGESKDGDECFWIIPLSGGDPFLLELDILVAGKRRPLRLSPDCKKLAFMVERSDEKSDLYVVPVSLKDGRTVGPDAVVFSGWDPNPKHSDSSMLTFSYHRAFSWSPDGAKIAVSHEGNIWVVSGDGGGPVQVTVRKRPTHKADPEDYRANPAWSPDGKMISYKVYHSEKDQILRVIPASGSEDTVVLDIPLVGRRNPYEWSADSKDFVFESGGVLSAISIADGKSRRILDLPIGSAWGFSWSPDRQKLAFIGYTAVEGSGDEDKYQIFMIPAEGGKFTELAVDDPGEKYWLWWSPDGKWISYQSDGFIKARPEGTMWEADFEEIVKKASR